MPLTSDEKRNLVEQYREGLAKAANAFILGFEGISVPQVTELRSQVREGGGSYVVVKNTLVLRAIENADLGELGDRFNGATAVVYSDESPVALAKVLADFAKEVPALRFKGGLVEGRVVEAEEVEQLAALPTREELLAKLLFLLQSPVVRLARTLAAVPQQLVIALDQIKAKKGAE